MLTFIYAVLLIAVIVWSTRKPKPRVERRRKECELTESELWAERAERMFDRRS